ncbi:hypothetical protein [Xanthomonas sacchari]|uniref:hypothetical protein n=1 Tax=Xanthomonas sacchari TaxID=56458 RepID=UPI0031BC9C29|nr:hypothetical protein [Xanthomonas campestris pv. cannae]
MYIEITEFRKMLEAGQRYLGGTCCIQELNSRVSQCRDAARFWGGHPALAQVVDDWSQVVDRRWNEWGHSPDPLTEQQFESWLGQQLTLLSAHA